MSGNRVQGSDSRPLITLRDVDVTLGRRRVLSRASLTIREGEHCALLGANGSGKTTLLRLLAGEQWPAPDSPGRPLFHFESPASESPLAARPYLALVTAEQQERFRRYEWPQTGEGFLRAGFRNALYIQDGLLPEEEKRFAELAELFALGELLGKRVREMSQGEARRVLIARALTRRPRLLLLDEVANGLSEEARGEVLPFLSRLAQSGVTLVMTSHREEELIPEIGRVALLERGAVIATGEREEMRARYRARCARNGKTAPVPAKLTKPCVDSGTPLIDIRGADVYQGRTRILRGIDWRLRPGEHWAIVGGNGSGKTTFLLLLQGLLRPALGGSIRWRGLGNAPSLGEIRAFSGYVGAELQAEYHYNVTALEAVASGVYTSIGLYVYIDRQLREKASRWLRFFGMEDRADQAIHTLSHGEFRRVLLARALIREPEILLLDEPFSGLDRSAAEELKVLLEQLAARGTAIVLATHHEEDWLGCINRLGVFEGGRMIRQEVVPVSR